MNFKRLFAIAVAVNVTLLAVVPLDVELAPPSLDAG